MAVSFQKYNRKKNFEDKKEQIVNDLESVNIEDAVRGAIMAATGQNTILGVDYTLQKEHCIEQAEKFDQVTATVRDMLDQAKTE